MTVFYDWVLPTLIVIAAILLGLGWIVLQNRIKAKRPYHIGTWLRNWEGNGEGAMEWYPMRDTPGFHTYADAARYISTSKSNPNLRWSNVVIRDMRVPITKEDHDSLA